VAMHRRVDLTDVISTEHRIPSCSRRMIRFCPSDVCRRRRFLRSTIHRNLLRSLPSLVWA
jgi:hypothetical protein